jgi:hypothetical protein
MVFVFPRKCMRVIVWFYGQSLSLREGCLRGDYKWVVCRITVGHRAFPGLVASPELGEG